MNFISTYFTVQSKGNTIVTVFTHQKATLHLESDRENSFYSDTH